MWPSHAARTTHTQRQRPSSTCATHRPGGPITQAVRSAVLGLCAVLCPSGASCRPIRRDPRFPVRTPLRKRERRPPRPTRHGETATRNLSRGCPSPSIQLDIMSIIDLAGCRWFRCMRPPARPAPPSNGRGPGGQTLRRFALVARPPRLIQPGHHRFTQNALPPGSGEDHVALRSAGRCRSGWRRV